MSDDLHRLEIEPVELWARRSADQLATTMRRVLAARSTCLIGLSGGSTPGPVFQDLATRSLDWDRVTIIQVDERLAPPGHPDRNLTGLRDAFDHLPVTWLPLPVDRIVDAAGELLVDEVAPALHQFTSQLTALADDPPVLDVVQLGLGADGHTASLVAGDPAVSDLRNYVALTGEYAGYRRLTLTRPVFDRSRCVVWLVRGAAKAESLGRLLAGDLTLPAGLVRPRQSLVIADADAARQH